MNSPAFYLILVTSQINQESDLEIRERQILATLVTIQVITASLNNR